MDRMSIGEFARASRLSPKALRLYDELDLLAPAHVDAASGYRYYEAAQLEAARLVAVLRQLEVPLVEIKVILGQTQTQAAAHIAHYWADVEGDHAERRALAASLVDRLNGKRSAMHDVVQNSMPHRTLLCLKRHADNEGEAWALGKEFIGIMKERPMPRMGKGPGADFLIYHGEVNVDSDGPVEWCHPIPDDQAEAMAVRYPELAVRTEPAHDEAWAHVGPGGQVPPATWERASEGLRQWAADSGRLASDLGVRIIYEFAEAGPDCSFAVPLT